MLYRVSEIICEQLGLNIPVHAQFLQCVKIYYIRSRKLSDECSRYIPISLDVRGVLPRGLEFHNLLVDNRIVCAPNTCIYYCKQKQKTNI